MACHHPRENPFHLLDWAIISLVLGTIAWLLFFLPVLAVPIAVCGITLGLIAAVSAFWRSSESLRWALTGICCSVAALGVGLAINFAPLGEEPRPDVPQLWQQPSSPLFVSPPAKPNFMEDLVTED